MFEYQIVIEYHREDEPVDFLVLNPLSFINPFFKGDRVHIAEYNLGEVTHVAHNHDGTKALLSEVGIRSPPYTPQGTDANIFFDKFQKGDTKVLSLVDHLDRELPDEE